MIFGPMPVTDAVDAILAHGTRHAHGTFKKGRRLSAPDIAVLQEAGHETVIAARLSPDDIPEDDAARAVSLAACGPGAKAQEAFTGRANIYSAARGLLVLDEARVKALNHIHESLTIATLPNYARVEPKQMVATIKVIPFAVPRGVLDQALSIIGAEPVLSVAAFSAPSAGLIVTQLPHSKPGLIQKSQNAIADRLAAMGATLGQTRIVPHAERDVALAISDLQAHACSPLLIFGASAIVDRADVIPAAVVAAGGAVIHLGMPVDPGNLLMLGQVGETTVIGVPSCARSPKVNGFDWVLERLIAGLAVTGRDIMDMGAGGLLAEIPSRPSPREGRGKLPSAPRVVAVVLAAGTSSRMGVHKLLADVGGQPLLRATLDAISRSAVDDIIVVTGHEGAEVQAVVADLRFRCVVNPDYAMGLAHSLAAGVRAAGAAEAIVVCLGDMPRVDPRTIDKLIAAYNPDEHRSIIVPVFKGQFGNPVLWGAEHFPRLMALTGDKGARALLPDLRSEAIEIDVDDPGILVDADTPEALAQLRAMAPLK